MKPSRPSAFIREEVLGVRRATLSDLVNEKAGLSPEMALRIEKAFGISMVLGMQAWHDGWTMRQHADEIAVARYVPAERRGAGASSGHWSVRPGCTSRER